MGREIIWTDSAVADLEAIVPRITAERPQAARKVGNAIVAQVEKLRALPTLGSPYRPRLHGGIRETAYKKYRIFYRAQVAANSIEILAIWHGSRREPRLPD